MQIFLFRESKGNVVHGSDNKKRTGCGINLQRPDNMAKYTVGGTIDDVFELMTSVTCEKCQTAFTKKVLKADQKERNRMLKEEKKRAKTMGEDPNIVPLAEVQKTKKKNAAAPVKEPVPETPAVEEVPVQEEIAVPEIPAPAAPPVEEAPVPEFEEYVPPTKKPAAAPGYSGFQMDSDLAQFALPNTGIDPTAAAFAANEGKNPNILAEQQKQEEPEDIMAQFALPKSAPVLDDPEDIMAQFAMPQSTPAAVPEAVTDVPDTEDADDIMAQFSIPEPAEAPAAPEAPVVNDLEDTMAQFSVDEAAEAPAVPEAPAADALDDIMAQFSVDDVVETPAAPEAPAADALDDIMAQFSVEEPVNASVEPERDIFAEMSDMAVENTIHMEIDEFDMIAERMFGAHRPRPAESEAAVAEPEILAEEEDDIASLLMPMDHDIAEPVEAAVVTDEVEDNVIEVPHISIPVSEMSPAEPDVPVLEPENITVPEMPAFTAPAVEELPEEIEEVAVPEVPAFTAPAAPAAEPVQPAPAAPAFTNPAPMQTAVPNAVMPQMAQPVQNVQGMPNMQTMQPMFMGYDAQGQPVYGYAQPVMPQFMGYDAQGQPVYAQPMMQQPYAQPVQQTPVAQPIPAPVQVAAPALAPVQPAPAPAQPAPAPVPEPAPVKEAAPVKKRPLISPMTAEPVAAATHALPEDTEQPTVEPMSYPKKKKSQGVRVSTIKQAEMPDVIRSAVSKSAAPQGNIFDQQNAEVAVVDNIEDILSMMGEDTSKYKKNEPDVNLQFKEYKVKPKKEPKKTTEAEPKPAEEAARPLTKEELKRQKREEKINAKFKKDLAKRGF